jgi:hypothetical protein
MEVKKCTLAELQVLLDARCAAGAEKDTQGEALTKVFPMARRRRGVNLTAKPSSELAACRAGSKQDHLAKGSTLAELVAALEPWSDSSVKSALYWDIAKVKGYTPRRRCGTQRDHLVLPKGVEAPLGHVEPARSGSTVWP